jgi:hypothetical protein
MNSTNMHFTFIANYRIPFVISVMLLSGFSILPASGQNPWLESDKPLIDDRNQDSSEDNTWRDKVVSEPDNEINESKYPPLDEDETLGTGQFGYSAEDMTSQDSSSVTGGSDLRYPDAQAFGQQMPFYPGNRQQNRYGYYGNQQFPYSRPGYRSAYPGYRRDYWPGSGGVGGFPFGGGNEWMPFSYPGFW